MNKTWKMLLLSSTCACIPGIALAAAPTADTGYWAGPYVGGQIGLNDASANGLSSEDSFTIGPHIGYNIALPLHGLSSPLILGADAFAEFNGESTHTVGSGIQGPKFGSNVYGIDALAGIPLGAQHRIMPYVKIGFGTVNATGDLDNSDTSFRVGFGAEYRLRRNWGVTGEFMHQDAGRITNNNFTVGVNYHFGNY